MNKYLKHFNYVIRHKWFVFIECYKQKIIWLGIIHDWSKFLPSEFIPYAKYGKGYYKSYNTKDSNFHFAWFLHRRRNKHHWQYWTILTEDGELKNFEMPEKYRKEMFADWQAMNNIPNTCNAKILYHKIRNKIQLASLTRDWIDEQTTI